MNNIVAIVGRPNVGKSTLFNRLTTPRTAIEEKMPGVTRDRLYGTTEWSGRELVFIDTGGVTFGGENRIAVLVRQQVELAIEEAGLIIFLLDGREGLTALDEEIGLMLRCSGKRVIPVVNKIDIYEQDAGKYDFYKLNFGDPLSISAAHGKGSGELLDLILSYLPPEIKEEDSYRPEIVKVAVIGRPNVGKSSLINKMLGEERVIVSEIPGTTRDAIDTYFEYGEQPYLFIDTAGIRRKSKIKEPVEYYSILRSLKAVQRADLVLLMLDGVDGITEQDQRLAGYVDQAGRGLIIVVNKWDLARGTEHARADYMDHLKRQFSFVPYAHQVFLSALTGWKLDQVYPLILQTWQEQHKRISTSLLNELLEDALAVNPPPAVKGKRVRLFYMTQPAVKPPTFVIFANEPDLVHFSYRRYLENRLRESFSFKGTPIIIKLKKRQRRGD